MYKMNNCSQRQNWDKRMTLFEQSLLVLHFI